MDKAQQHVTNLAEIFFQGAIRIVDIQTTAARVLLQTQGRSAAMFGAPDWTPAVTRQGERFSQLLSIGAEETLRIMRQANETVSEVQQQVGQLIQQRTAQVADEVRNGVEEVGRRTEEGLEQLRHTSQQAAAQVQRGARRMNGGHANGRHARSRTRA
jgi:ABC-type transporter Mla subunit MlaD